MANSVGVKIVVVLHKFAVSRNLFFQRILYPCLTSTPIVLARTTPLVLTVKSQRGKWSRAVEVIGDRPETFCLGPHHSILITRWSVYSRMVQQHWTWDRQHRVTSESSRCSYDDHVLRFVRIIPITIM